MAALTAGMKVLARSLLAWDRERLADIATARPDEDLSVYRARQDLAEVCIDADIASWPVEIVDLFHGALEATRTPLSTAMQRGIGLIRHRPWPALTAEEVLAYKELARAIGRIRYMKEVAPVLWREDGDAGHVREGRQ